LSASGSRAASLPIAEALHGPRFVAMVAALFGGEPEAAADVEALDPGQIDWSTTANGRT